MERDNDQSAKGFKVSESITRSDESFSSQAMAVGRHRWRGGSRQGAVALRIYRLVNSASGTAVLVVRSTTKRAFFS
jgi:hypothetical protein